MKRVIILKLVVDFVMTVLLFTAMTYRITDNRIHELVGISICMLFAVHNVLNRRWYAKLLTGKYDVLRVIRTSVNILLLLAISAVLISSLYISQTVFEFLPFDGSLFIRQIHVASAYWGFILMSIHMGQHWGMVVGMIRKRAKIADGHILGIVLLRAAAAAAAVCGVLFSLERNIGSKLFLNDTFDFWDKDKSVILFFAGYLSVMGVYIFITYYALKCIQKCKVVPKKHNLF